MSSTATLRGVIRLLLDSADREVRTRLAAAVLILCMGGLLTAAAPLALKALVDIVANGPLPFGLVEQGATLLALAYVGTLCIGRMLNEVRPLLTGAAEQRLQGRLSRRLFAHVMQLPASFHLDRKTGALTQTLTQASAAAQLILNSVMQSLPLVVELATVVVVLHHLGQPALIAVFVLSTVAYAIVFRDGTSRIRSRSKDVSASALAAHASISDALLNIETIKCFNAHDSVNQRFSTLTSAVERAWCGLHRQRMKLGLTAATIFALSVVCSLLAAMAAVEHGSLSVGGFVLSTVYMLQMVRPIETLGAAARDIGQALEFIYPAVRILNLPVERTSNHPEGQPRASDGNPVDIHLHNVALSYTGGPKVLEELDLHIEAGETLAIVGPSGSGKSSLARLLLGLVEPDSGQILLGRTFSRDLDPAAIRAMFGVVTQDVLLFDDTVAVNVAVGRPHATQAEIEAACHVACIHEFIKSLPAGYDTRVGERGLKLSGGERQRVAIARAVLKRPLIYLFDEATSALDSQIEAAVAEDLARICAGHTTIVITHRLAMARQADRIAVLQAGRIEELGTPRELLERNGTYARMYRRQCRIDESLPEAFEWS